MKIGAERGNLYLMRLPGRIKARGGRIGQPRKFNDDDVKEIMDMVREGRTVKEIAALKGVVPATIYNYLEGTVTELREEGRKRRERKKRAK